MMNVARMVFVFALLIAVGCGDDVTLSDGGTADAGTDTAVDVSSDVAQDTDEVTPSCPSYSYFLPAAGQPLDSANVAINTEPATIVVLLPDAPDLWFIALEPERIERQTTYTISPIDSDAPVRLLRGTGCSTSDYLQCESYSQAEAGTEVFVRELQVGASASWLSVGRFGTVPVEFDREGW